MDSEFHTYQGDKTDSQNLLKEYEEPWRKVIGEF